MWSSTRPGAGLARLMALEDRIRDFLPDLNDAMQNHGDLAYLIQNYGAVDMTCVDIGDLELMPDIASGWVQIRVCNGGHREGLDFTSQLTYSTPDQTTDTFHTVIIAYVHPDAFRVNDEGPLQTRLMTFAQEMVSDWLRARVLNFVGTINGVWQDPRILKLNSQERFNDGMLDGDGNQLTDELSDCVIASGTKGWFARNFDSKIIFGCQFVHSGVLR